MELYDTHTHMCIHTQNVKHMSAIYKAWIRSVRELTSLLRITHPHLFGLSTGTLTKTHFVARYVLLLDPI